MSPLAPQSKSRQPPQARHFRRTRGLKRTKTNRSTFIIQQQRCCCFRNRPECGKNPCNRQLWGAPPPDYGGGGGYGGSAQPAAVMVATGVPVAAPYRQQMPQQPQYQQQMQQGGIPIAVPIIRSSVSPPPVAQPITASARRCSSSEPASLFVAAEREGADQVEAFCRLF